MEGPACSAFACADFADFGIDIEIIPAFEGCWFVLDQVGLHGEAGLGEIEGFFEVGLVGGVCCASVVVGHRVIS